MNFICEIIKIFIAKIQAKERSENNSISNLKHLNTNFPENRFFILSVGDLEQYLQ